MEDTRKKYVYSVSTGVINPLKRKSRQAVDFLTKQEGFFAIHLAGDLGTLFLYETENDAKGVRNMAREKGILCGKNICKFEYDERNCCLIPAYEVK